MSDPTEPMPPDADRPILPEPPPTEIIPDPERPVPTDPEEG